MLRELRYYARMAGGVAHSVRQPVSKDPEGFVRDRLQNRERTFLSIAERVIFRNPEHPFHVMFHAAGCEFGDLSEAVNRAGLDHTLAELQRQGVYLSHDEWKGRIPLIRSGREIRATAGSFRNPLIKGWLESSSSGSTGLPVPTTRSTEALMHGAVYHMLRAREFGGHRCVWIDLKSILPSTVGLNGVLRGRRTGTPVERWFSADSPFLNDGHYLLATRALIALGNIFGARAPYPEFLSRNDFAPVARYLAQRLANGHVPTVHGFASPLVRVASAAIEKGIDISGTIFFCGGEALSPAKVDVFEKAGARAFSSYTVSELGNIGAACSQMRGSCVHLYADSIAAIGVPKSDPEGDRELVNSLHFTTLAPHAPNIFINLEIDDEGMIEPAACDCTYSRIGLTHCIRQIQSFGKTNPQGMTFHRADLADIVERLLPARLGGGPGDYQLIECEAQNGQTQLLLHVNPRLGLTDRDHIRDVFLEVIKPHWGGSLAAREWAHSAGVEVAIAEPVETRTGKVHPVRVLGAARRARTEERLTTNAPS